jgi:flagellar protein FlgJ
MSTSSAVIGSSLKDSAMLNIQQQSNKIQNQKTPAQSKLSKAQMDKIDKTAEDFESVFLSQMMSHMFEGIEADENFGGGQGEEMVKSMLTDEYGKLIARTGGIGVADYVKREMLTLQEVKS